MRTPTKKTPNLLKELYGQCVIAPDKVFMQDPCSLDLPERLAGARMNQGVDYGLVSVVMASWGYIRE